MWSLWDRTDNYIGICTRHLPLHCFCYEETGGGCLELLSEGHDLGDEAKLLFTLFSCPLLLLAVKCELSQLFLLLILVFLINSLSFWLINHVRLGVLPKRLSSDCSLFAVTRSPGSCVMTRVWWLSSSVQGVGCVIGAPPRRTSTSAGSAPEGGSLLITLGCPSN